MTGPAPSGPPDNRPPGHPPAPPVPPAPAVEPPSVLLSLFIAVMCAALLAVGCVVMLVGLTRAVW